MGKAATREPSDGRMDDVEHGEGIGEEEHYGRRDGTEDEVDEGEYFGPNGERISGYEYRRRLQGLDRRHRLNLKAERENEHRAAARTDVELSIVYLNMDGVGIDFQGRGLKVEYLQAMLKRIEARTLARVHLVGICETKLGGSFYLERAAEEMDFYVAARMDRKAGAGGVAILAAKGLDTQPVECPEAYDEHGEPRVEICAVRVSGLHRQWQVVVGYRPPDNSKSPTKRPEVFFESLSCRVRAADEEGEGALTIYGGDFNWHGLNLPQAGTAHACEPGEREEGDVAAEAITTAPLVRVSGTKAQCPIPGDEYTYVTGSVWREHDYVLVSPAAADDVIFCRALADIGWPYEDHLPVLTVIRSCEEGLDRFRRVGEALDPEPELKRTGSRSMWREASDEGIAQYEAATDRWCREYLAFLQSAAGQGTSATASMGAIAAALRRAERGSIPHVSGGRGGERGYDRWYVEWKDKFFDASTSVYLARKAIALGDPEEARAHFAEAGMHRLTLERWRKEEFIAELFHKDRKEQQRPYRMGMAYQVLTRVIARGRLGKGRSARPPPHEFRGLRHPVTGQRVSGVPNIIDALDVGLRDIYAERPENPGYDRKAHAARHAESETILRRHIPASVARGHAAVAAVYEAMRQGMHPPAWEEWEERIRRGTHEPTGADLDVFCSWPYSAAESAAARDDTPTGKAPHPEEGLRPEAIKFAGEAFDELFAYVNNRMDERGDPEPDVWSEYHARWLYKGKGDRLDFRSYRDIVLASTLGKLRERLMLRRLRAFTQVDQLQGLENDGTDMRHQNALLVTRYAGTPGHSRATDVAGGDRYQARVPDSAPAASPLRPVAPRGARAAPARLLDAHEARRVRPRRARWHRRPARARGHQHAHGHRHLTPALHARHRYTTGETSHARQ